MRKIVVEQAVSGCYAGQWYVTRDNPEEYLHSDGEWRHYATSSVKGTGYYATRQAADEVRQRWIESHAPQATGRPHAVCDAFIELAKDAVDEWDGVDTQELVRAIYRKTQNHDPVDEMRDALLKASRVLGGLCMSECDEQFYRDAYPAVKAVRDVLKKYPSV